MKVPEPIRKKRGSIPNMPENIITHIFLNFHSPSMYVPIHIDNFKKT